MTPIIPRGQWQDPNKPITGTPIKPGITGSVLHWTGTAIDSPVEDGAQFLRNLQSVYLASRGYSLGYSYAVISGGSQDGWRYEIRGTTFLNAANKGTNETTRSVLVLGVTNANMTGAAVASVNSLLVGTLVGHRDVRATQCPGDWYYGQLEEINNYASQEDDDVTFIMKKKNTSSFHVADGVTRRYVASPQILIDAAVRAGKPLTDAATGRAVTSLSGVTAISGADIDGFGSVNG